jgi:hypothetical protein
MFETTERNLCRHIHLAGRRCGSPCLRGENFCYFHHTTRRPPKHLGQNPLDAVFTIPPLEDADIIQHTLADILARIATNSIDTKRARLLLYGLQIAARNLARCPTRAPEPNPNQINAVIEDLELDPDLGPLAPVAQVGAEAAAAEAANTDLRQRFIDYCNRPKEPCKQCAEYERLEANRAEGRRLMAELNRRRAAGLPDYDPPLNAGTPYPADQTWAATEASAAAPAAPSSPDIVILSAAKDPLLSSGAPTPPHAEDPNTPGLPNPTPQTLAKFAACLPDLKAVAEEPAKKPCRTPTRTRRPKQTPPTDSIPTTDPTDLTRRATRLTRAFRHRFYSPLTTSPSPSTAPSPTEAPTRSRPRPA